MSHNIDQCGNDIEYSISCSYDTEQVAALYHKSKGNIKQNPLGNNVHVADSNTDVPLSSHM